MTRDARTRLNHVHRAADPSGILASIGLVPYDWRIETDTLTWGANAAEVLQVADSAQIATGRGYAGFLDPKNTSTRYDAVMQGGGRDSGAGVPYQTEYCRAHRPGRRDAPLGRRQWPLVRWCRRAAGTRAWRGACDHGAPRQQ